MKPRLLGIFLALALLGSSVSWAAAQGTPSSPADSSVTKADSTSATPVPPAPAAAPPAAAAPAPAAAAAPSEAAAPATASKSKPNDRIYYGGTVTLGFGSTTTIGVFPMMGYKLTPKLSGGVEAGYEYVSYDNGKSTNNYGGSVFGRLRVGKNLYAHAEYRQINYEIFNSLNSSSREWVPALLLGGGLIKPLNARTSVYVEALVDVLQDENSPYNDWEPQVNFGVAVGF